MPSRACLRTFVAWIACCAVLVGSLAPAVSRALSGDAAQVWAEVCTTLGPKLVNTGDDAPAAPADALFQHCPYCSLHATALGMPPAAVGVPALARLGFALPALFLSAPRTLFAWAHAQPRAPPRFS